MAILLIQAKQTCLPLLNTPDEHNVQETRGTIYQLRDSAWFRAELYECEILETELSIAKCKYLINIMRAELCEFEF